MKIIRIIFLSFLALLNINYARADLPQYSRDENFFRCLRITQNWDPCLKENGDRVLKIIQQEYRTILHNPQLLSWNGTIEKNTQVMKDMYESWTAYRNRWCSLTVKAEKYTGPLVDSELSCIDYQNMRKEDYLSNIINLMNKKVPPKSSDYEFMRITDHDNKFKTCVKEAGEKSNLKTKTGQKILASNSAEYQNCLKEEMMRTNEQIKQYYADFLANELIGKWNNGPDLKSGNYRDMFDSWVAYRNRLCSLITWAYQKTYGDDSYSLNECILNLNKEKIEACSLMLEAAHSFLDDEVIYTDENGNQTEVDITEGDDGGASIGAKIKPLQRHINSEEDDIEGALTMDNNKADDKREKPTEEKKLPAWAQ